LVSPSRVPGASPCKWRSSPAWRRSPTSTGPASWSAASDADAPRLHLRLGRVAWVLNVAGGKVDNAR
jgi:hypothetical protein